MSRRMLRCDTEAGNEEETQKTSIYGVPCACRLTEYLILGPFKNLFREVRATIHKLKYEHS
jgi:hypothetical protein